MRFSDQRYYVEEYVKCMNCGVLVYDADIQSTARASGEPVYCSDWCQQWAQLRRQGDDSQILLLPKNKP